MIYRYARASYIDQGGDPRAFDDLTWTDVLDWLCIHDPRNEWTALVGALGE